MSFIRSRQHARPLPAVLGLAVAAMPGMAAAQSAPQAAASEQTLPALRVTAPTISETKAEESSNGKFTAPLLDTPKTVTVVPVQVIEQTGSVSLVDALRTVPGISFGGGEGGSPLGDRPFIRGFDAQASTFVDGLRDIAPTSREVFNIESIEASKGPDSAYAGRGGAGGTIGIYTKTPQAEDFVSGSVAVGTDGHRRLTGDGNWRIGETAALRLNAMAHENDVPGRDGPDASRWGVAPSLAFGLGTPTRVVLSYTHLKTDDMPDGGVGYDLPSSFPAAGEVEVEPTYGGDRENWYGLLDRDFREEETDVGTFRIEHDLSPTTKLRNITRWSKTEIDYVWTQPDDSQGNIARGMLYRRFNSTIRNVEALATQTELSGEARTGDVQHRYVAGIELSRERADNSSYTVSGINYGTVSGVNYAKCPNGIGAASSYVCTSLTDPNPNDPWLGTLTPNAAGPTEFETRTVSAYVFDTLQLTPQWLVNAGLRYDRYHTTQLAARATVNGVPDVRLRYRQNDEFVNGQLGLVYKPVDNGSVYVSVGTSSTPAGSTTGQGLETQAVTLVNSNDLDPERNTSVELGTKWDLLDRRMQLTAAVFRIDTRNVRIANSDGTTTAAGDKEAKGVEFGVSGNLTRAWALFGGYTWLDAESTDAGVTNVGTTAAPNWVAAAATGRQFPTTARHSLSLWTTYQPVRALTLGAGVFAQSEMVGSWAYAAGTSGRTVIKRVVPGYGRIDAMAAYEFSRNLTLQLNVQNLNDKVYYTAASSPHYASIAAGRSAVLSANVRY